VGDWMYSHLTMGFDVGWEPGRVQRWRGFYIGMHVPFAMSDSVLSVHTV